MSVPDTKISIIMACNSMDNYFLSAINSMLNQTYKNIELILVVNGSLAADIENYILANIDDERLHVIVSPIAQLSSSLNLALIHSKGDLIARMDCDDISLPERLEEQVKYLYDKKLDLVGCDLTLIDEQGNVIGERKYPKGAKIKSSLPFKNPFAHNTILVKKKTLIEARGYNSGFNSEDYDLWFRLARSSNVAWDNMDVKLVEYRIHSAASQRKLLGYAESSALAMREFILQKSCINFIAVLYHVMKSFFRVKK
ncbi:glycosyltransferase [Providencia huaxiensis]|uniref:glycosyltransferase n=1 Tax=Providencia huaxiensis TaxID=2027290 RepID=UPI002FDF72AA